MPRTLPLGFWRAMRRPSPIAWWMPGGRSADAKRCATRTNFCVASSSSKTSLSVSAVSPDGPGAAAFRARRKLVRRRSAGMSTGSGGSYWSSAGSQCLVWCLWPAVGVGELVSGRQRSCAESLAGGGAAPFGLDVVAPGAILWYGVRPCC